MTAKNYDQPATLGDLIATQERISELETHVIETRRAIDEEVDARRTAVSGLFDDLGRVTAKLADGLAELEARLRERFENAAEHLVAAASHLDGRAWGINAPEVAGTQVSRPNGFAIRRSPMSSNVKTHDITDGLPEVDETNADVDAKPEVLCRLGDPPPREPVAAPTQPRYVDPEEFRRLGLLQELNRRFLHPMGMALAISVDEENGKTTFVGVQDFRHDPEGLCFADGVLDGDKARMVRQIWQSRIESRRRALGYVVQPLPGDGMEEAGDSVLVVGGLDAIEKA